MKPWPNRFDIFSAECRLAHSKLASRASFAQLGLVLHSRLTKSSTLLVATGLGVLFGRWFAHRDKPRVKQEAVSVRAPIVGLVYTFLIRFGLQRLAETWVRFRHPDPPTK